MYSSSAGPLVSICIPVFNHSDYVAECIESVIAQSYQNIELIIIDDGSTDLSYAIVERYIDACKARFHRFKVISRPNAGVSETLNEGLRWANGKYFCGLASDDVIFANKTSFLVEYLESNPDTVAAFGSVYIIDENSKKIGQRTANAIYSFKDIFLLRAELPAPAALIRLSELNSVGGFDKNTKVEDWDMWLKLSIGRRTAIAVVSDLLAGYRVHSSNTWKQLDVMHAAKVKIVERYSEHEYYAQARAVVECARFRDLSIARKKESLQVFFNIARIPQVYKELRFYQGLCYLFFRW
ncbi:glycosyltransferase [Pseudomonas sp. NPDC087614]|uniref:glycosyltransferase n=1 Tax=Pseudomonas sp. NPDC087614 TaxID=3364442 RepID=UPI00381A1999